MLRKSNMSIKKAYTKPEIETEKIEIGVFGKYGQSCEPGFHGPGFGGPGFHGPGFGGHHRPGH